MYIVAIAWLYVVGMMALTASSALAGIAILIGYGLAPLGLLLWIMGSPRRKKSRLANEQLGDPDGTDAEKNQRDLL